jgi:hypothetical protein
MLSCDYDFSGGQLRGLIKILWVMEDCLTFAEIIIEKWIYKFFQNSYVLKTHDFKAKITDFSRFKALWFFSKILWVKFCRYY